MSQITLSALFHFPIKSCSGWSHHDVMRIGPRGPEGDRVFMVTDDKYHFLTQRKEQGGFTKMALIIPRVHSGDAVLELDAPGMPHRVVYVRRASPLPTVRVTIFDDACDALDQGDEIATWLSSYLDTPCRLVRLADDYARPVDPIFCRSEPAQTGFADAFPILLISDASLADLNDRLQQRDRDPVSRENFRAAFWVSGCTPYEEDTWKRIVINGITFDVVKPCARCSITTVDPKTGLYRADHEPLVTLNAYRHQTIAKTGKQGVMFGQNLVHRGTGMVRVGSAVEVLERW